MPILSLLLSLHSSSLLHYHSPVEISSSWVAEDGSSERSVTARSSSQLRYGVDRSVSSPVQGIALGGASGSRGHAEKILGGQLRGEDSAEGNAEAGVEAGTGDDEEEDEDEDDDIVNVDTTVKIVAFVRRMTTDVSIPKITQFSYVLDERCSDTRKAFTHCNFRVLFS